MSSYDIALADHVVKRATAPTTDAELLKQIARGDEPAFEVLYRRHSTPLYNYLFRLTHHTTVAEDLLQEVLVVAWEKARSFRGDAQVKTWLFRIAHHQAISWLRREREVLTADNALFDQPVPPQGETQVMETWRAEQLGTALDKLSLEHRAVLELAYFYDMPHAEIAKIMDCPVGTVKSRLSHARRSLSLHLQALGVKR